MPPRTTEVEDSPTSNLAPSKWIRAVRHVNQAPHKFKFEILVEEVRLCTDKDICISLEWIRGPKRSRSKERRIIRKSGAAAAASPTNWQMGAANNHNKHFASFEEPIALLATLFTNGKATGPGGLPSSFCEKTSRLAVVELVGSQSADEIIKMARPGVGRTLGEIVFDLASFAHTCGGRFERCVRPLGKCRDSEAKIVFVMGCVHLGSGPDGSSAHDDDIKSLSSQSVTAVGHSDGSNMRTPSFGTNSDRSAAPNRQEKSARQSKDGERVGVRQLESSLRPAPLGDCDDLQSPLHGGSKITTCPSCETLETRNRHMNEEIVALRKATAERLRMSDEATAAAEVRATTAEKARLKAEEERDDRVATLLSQLEEMHGALERSQQIQALTEDEPSTDSFLTVETLPTEGLPMHPHSPSKRAHPSSTTAAFLSNTATSLEAPNDGQSIRSDQSKARQLATSTVDSALKAEVLGLRRRLAAANDEIKAFHKAMDAEKAKSMMGIAEAEKAVTEDKRRHIETKADLEKKLSTTGATLSQFQSAHAEERKRRTGAEKQVTMLRQQLSERPQQEGEDSVVESQLLSLHQEVTDLTKSRDSLRRDFQSRESKWSTHIGALKSANEEQKEMLGLQSHKFGSERKMLKERIDELEGEIATLPRPSMVARMNAESHKYQTALQRVIGQHQKLVAALGNRQVVGETQITDMMRGIEKQYEAAIRETANLTSRISELEDELIKTKMAVAESEQRREEQTVNDRRKVEFLKEQLKNYAAIISELEVKIEDWKLRRKSKRSKSSLHSIKAWASRNWGASSREEVNHGVTKSQSECIGGAAATTTCGRSASLSQSHPAPISDNSRSPTRHHSYASSSLRAANPSESRSRSPPARSQSQSPSNTQEDASSKENLSRENVSRVGGMRR